MRTCQHTKRIPELGALDQEKNVNIVCFQGHWLCHEETTEDVDYINIGNNWMFACSSTKKNDANTSIGGIGMLLSPSAFWILSQVQKVNSRIMTATFSGNPQVTIIWCYSLKNANLEEIKQQFYDSLATITRNVPTQNVTIVAGDMNAKLSLEHSKQHSVFSDETNSNGYKFLDLLAKCQLIVQNTYFCKCKGKLWTSRFPNGERSQIDYILLNKKCRNSARNCEAYSTFSSIGSDHWIVQVEITLSLCAKRKCARSHGTIGQNSSTIKTYNHSTQLQWKLVQPTNLKRWWETNWPQTRPTCWPHLQCASKGPYWCCWGNNCKED